MSHLTLTDDNFDKEVMQSSVPVLVDFWAEWCGPCRIQGPIVEEIAGEVDAGKAKVGKLNVDENQKSSSQFGIMSIPTLIVFKDGKVAEQLVGLQDKDTIVKALEKHMS